MTGKKDKDRDENWAGKGFTRLNEESALPKDDEGDDE